MAILRSIRDGLLWLLWLVATVVLALPMVLLELAMPNRSDHHDREHGFHNPHVPLMIALDTLAALATYFLADILRCTVAGRDWPEVVPGQGSTLRLHLEMAVAVTIAWPLILHWLGWYKPRWRSWVWRLRGTAAAAVLLGLVMSAVSLLLHRELYPRSQIAYTVVLIPVVTALILSCRIWYLRAVRSDDPSLDLRSEL